MGKLAISSQVLSDFDENESVDDFVPVEFFHGFSPTTVIGLGRVRTLERLGREIEPLPVRMLKIMFAGVHIVGYVYLANENMRLL